MEIQKVILLFFSSLHTPFTVALADVITTFGTELPIIAFLLFIYYSIDKKKGAASCLTFMVATNIMSTIKAIVRFPRPWSVINGLDSQSMKGATGYSFPSGHTTCAASAYTSLAISFKKKWISRLCATMILLVGFSRMFLCVHWPLDVAGGLLVGCGSALLLVNAFLKLFEDSKKNAKILIPVGVVASVAALAMGILIFFNLIDETAYGDFSKTLASFGGLCCGFVIESSSFNFKVEEKNWKNKIIRFVLSMLGVLVLLPGLKAVLVKIGLYNAITAQARYLLTGLWATIFPLIAKRLFPERY